MRVRLTARPRNGSPESGWRTGTPPWGRFYYGWAIVGVLALTVTVSYGVLLYAFPVVLAAMQADLGWSQQTLTGAYSVGALVGGLAAIPTGRWLDEHGPRGAMTASAIAASVLVVAWSRVDSRGAWYLIWVGLGACSAGLFYEPAFATVVQWFQRYRGGAMTILTVVGGLASTIFVPITAELMARFGWRTAVLMLAGILAAFTILPHALVLRRGPADLDPRADGAAPGVTYGSDESLAGATAARKIFHSRSFRWLTAAFFMSTVANMAFIVHLIPLLLERGHTVALASAALAGVGFTKLVGRLLLVPFARRLNLTRATVAVLVLQAGGLVVLLTGSSAVTVWICVALFGIGDGASTPARGELVAELFGRSGYGTISGVVALFLAGARALGPVGVSLLYAVTGGYGGPLLVMILVLLLAGGALYFAGTAARRWAPPS